MAQKENKSKAGKTGKSRNKKMTNHSQEHDLESGDNPEERSKMTDDK